MGAAVLVVEDAPDVRELVAEVLGAAGFAVTGAATGQDGLAAAARLRPEVVVLDLGLPDLDGTEVCRALRAGHDPYVLMLTGRSGEVDLLVGLAVGADDYMTKPFSPRELVARVQALLRRTRRSDAPRDRPDPPDPPDPSTTADPSAPSDPPTPPDLGDVRRLGDLEIDVGSREVQVAARPLTLTRTEFDLLAVLSSRPGRVWQRETLLREVWRTDWSDNVRLVEVHVSNLRRKLVAAGLRHPDIRTVRGIGYRLVV